MILKKNLENYKIYKYLLNEKIMDFQQAIIKV